MVHHCFAADHNGIQRRCALDTMQPNTQDLGSDAPGQLLGEQSGHQDLDWDWRWVAPLLLENGG